MQIRTMKIEDTPDMEQLMHHLGYPTTTAQLHNRFQKLLKCRNYQTFVAETDEILVGFVGMVKQIAYEFDDPYVRVLALVVHERYRGQKIGQKLMKAAETWAIENGCTVVTLNSGNRPERIAAHKFYEHLGYVGKSTGFSKNL